MGTAWQSIRDGEAEQMLGEGLRNGPLCGTQEEDIIAQALLRVLIMHQPKNREIKMRHAIKVYSTIKLMYIAA